MADLTLTGKNNQKRGVAVMVCETIATTATMDDTLATLPVGVVVTDVKVVVETISGGLNPTVDVKLGTTVIGNEMDIGTVGIAAGTVVPTYAATGGAISVAAGAVAPDTAGRIRVMVEYVELDTTNGLYIG